LGTAGLESREQLDPKHINRRVNGMNTKTYAQLYPCIGPDGLLHDETIPKDWKDDWHAANAAHW